MAVIQQVLSEIMELGSIVLNIYLLIYNKWQYFVVCKSLDSLLNEVLVIVLTFHDKTGFMFITLVVIDESTVSLCEKHSLKTNSNPYSKIIVPFKVVGVFINIGYKFSLGK